MNELAILWEQLAIGNQQFDGAFRPMVSGQRQQSAFSPKQLAISNWQLAKNPAAN
jgi:hypothetical protein